MDDRLALSEAIEAVGRMIRGYANKGQADKSYIGAIAELLMHYPKSVALACADPFHGVVSQSEFMPTPASVIAFCEKRVTPMREEADREDRIAGQLRAREEWLNYQPSERLKEMGKAWLDRTDPIAKQLTRHNSEEAQARKEAGLANIERANRAVFENECKRAGLDPHKGVSPSLLKTLDNPSWANADQPS